MSGYVQAINDPYQSMKALLKLLPPRCSAAGTRLPGRLVLSLAGTMTSDLPDVSAAGATPALRRLTPATDAEALVLGNRAGGEPLPVSPAGIVSPVVITRAALRFLDCPVTIVDCGTFQSPAVPHVAAGVSPARCLSTGEALAPSLVENLWLAGLRLGEELSRATRYLILGECVPGGTTTALAVLTALGYPAKGLLSGSLIGLNHELKWQLVNQGISRSGLSCESIAEKPLAAVAAVGDPMQPLVAGAAVAASTHVPVVLAGGSQMLAVWALLKALVAAGRLAARLSGITVVTTKWVAFDSQAGCPELARLVGAPFAASCPDFYSSRHPGLQAYEQGHVKEGVAAGGSLALARLAGRAAPAEIMSAIDCEYDRLVVGRADTVSGDDRSALRAGRARPAPDLAFDRGRAQPAAASEIETKE